jgi:hypothetical protein
MEIDMKLPYVAAAALLLGTSAFAWVPEGAPEGVMAPEPAAVADPPALQPIAAETWAQPATEAGDPDLDLAAKPDDLSKGVDLEASDTGEADTSDAGVGGPIETADAADAPLDLSPRAASQNYPACHPGPGDDNCIQLYEPGVRVALASWNQPTGGLGDGNAVAMGGPDEPVADDSADEGAETAMNGDGAVDPGAGEVASDGVY